MFLEKHVEDLICKWLKFYFSIYLQLCHQVLLFYKGIDFLKDCVILTSNNYYVTDSHFMKSSVLKPIIESSNLGTNILWVKKEKTVFNFKDRNGPYHKETSPLIWRAGQPMICTSVMTELKLWSSNTSQSWNYIFETFRSNNM